MSISFNLYTQIKLMTTVNPQCIQPSTVNYGYIRTWRRSGLRMSAQWHPIYAATPTMLVKKDMRRWRSCLSFRKVIMWDSRTSFAVWGESSRTLHKPSKTVIKLTVLLVWKAGLSMMMGDIKLLWWLCLAYPTLCTNIWKWLNVNYIYE